LSRSEDLRVALIWASEGEKETKRNLETDSRKGEEPVWMAELEGNI
jgi:hypothetical protein